MSAALSTLTREDLPTLDSLGPATSEGWREVQVFGGGGVHASLFLVPAGASLPLHDHPRMTVFLRVVAGRLRIRSLDWVTDAGPGLVREIANLEVPSEAPPCILFPEHGNLHAIESAHDGESIFLDLFAPYYDDTLRPCTCYRETATLSWRGETLICLEAAPDLDPDHR